MEINKNPLEQIALSLPQKLGDALRRIPEEQKTKVREIRFRQGAPACLLVGDTPLFLSREGQLLCRPDDGALFLDRPMMEEAFRSLCGYAVHTHENELRQGFVTLPGGHRAGICGTGVYHNGTLCGLREISSLNIRVARQVFGAADELLARWRMRGSLLLAGPPASGKTTLLRDLARQLGSGFLGRIYQVALIDERGEIAAAVSGRPQMDVGLCTDVLSGVFKTDGLSMAVRTLSPQLLICDELGGDREIPAINEASSSGIAVVATVHGGSLEEICRKQFVRRLLDMGLFGAVAVLDRGENVGKIKQWMDGKEIADEMARYLDVGGGVRCGRTICGVAVAPQDPAFGGRHLAGDVFKNPAAFYAGGAAVYGRRGVADGNGGRTSVSANLP